MTETTTMRLRVREWRTRLVEWASRQVGRSFVWGETDCATLARRSLQECFGEDVVPNVPSWRSRRTAARVLKVYPPLAVLEGLGAVKSPITFARAGDIVSIPATDVLGEIVLGVWIDGACLVASKEGGVQLIPAVDVPRGAVAYSVWEIPARG